MLTDEVQSMGLVAARSAVLRGASRASAAHSPKDVKAVYKG